MRFKRFLWLEIKRLLTWRHMAIILIFLTVAGYFVQIGISQHNYTLTEKDNFQKFEREKYQQFFYPSNYANYGLRLLFVPSSFMAFFNGGPVPDFLMAFLDGSERLKIYQSFKGKNAFSRITSNFMSFAGFIQLFGSLLVLLYGLETLKNYTWLAFLEGIAGSRKILFLYLLISRILILLLICLLLGVLSILLFIVNGVEVEPVKILLYSLGIFMCLSVFWFIGLGAGAVKDRLNSISIAIAVWFFLAFVVPVILQQWTYNRAFKMSSIFQRETEEIKLFMNYEKTSLEKAGKFELSKAGTDDERDMFLAFWNNDFRKLIDLEKETIKEMKAPISFYQNLAALFPSTFFISVSNEVSSRGFANLVNFYEFSLEKKKDFIWYLAENLLITKEMKFLPFLKEDENVYPGKIQLPYNFSFGFTITILWLLLLSYYSWISFNRLFNRSVEKTEELNPEDFDKNKTTIVLTSNQRLASGLLYNLRSKKTGFVYVPGPGDLQEAKVKDLFLFFSQEVPEKLQKVKGKYMHDLSPDHKGLILLEIVQTIKADFYIFNNFLTGLSDKFGDYFADFLQTFKKGRKVVYFTSSLAVSSKIGDDVLRFLDDNGLF